MVASQVLLCAPLAWPLVLWDGNCKARRRPCTHLGCSPRCGHFFSHRLRSGGCARCMGTHAGPAITCCARIHSWPCAAFGKFAANMPCSLPARRCSSLVVPWGTARFAGPMAPCSLPARLRPERMRTWERMVCIPSIVLLCAPSSYRYPAHRRADWMLTVRSDGQPTSCCRSGICN